MVDIPILMGRLYKYNYKKYEYTCAATLRRTEQASIFVLFLLGCRNVTGPHQNRENNLEKHMLPR